MYQPKSRKIGLFVAGAILGIPLTAYLIAQDQKADNAIVATASSPQKYRDFKMPTADELRRFGKDAHREWLEQTARMPMLNSSALAREYDLDATAADAKFKRAHIGLQGTVTQVLRTDEGRPMLLLEGHNSRSFVAAYIADSDGALAAQMFVPQFIVLSCLGVGSYRSVPAFECAFWRPEWDAEIKQLNAARVRVR